MGAAAFVPSLAMAQSAPQDPATEGQDSQDEASDVQDVVVVGSRLRRDNYNSPSPVTVVTREEAVLAGFASTTEVLQGTAITGGTAQINNAYGGFVTNGGPGANTLSLRGLGATRTLVLLNGRRVAPAGSRGSVGSADLNVLPSAMIERIEVLRDGASSIYGSDAVAGVVNIITRNNIDGISVEGQYNATLDANGAGDQSRISIVGGTSGDRWHVSGSAEYYNREELTLADRDFAQCNTDSFTGAGGRTDFIDPLTGQSKCYPITTTGSNGVTINTIGTPNILIYGNSAYARALGGPANTTGVGAWYQANRFRPGVASTGLPGFEVVGGTVVTTVNGAGSPTAIAAASTNIRDTFEERMLNESLISPVEVGTIYLEGAYDTGILGNAEVYGELLLNQRKSSQTGYRQLTIDYLQGSPLIPAALQFAAPFAANQGLSPTTGPRANAPVGIRAFVGFGNDQSSQEVNFAKQLAGIRGDLFIPEWRYDAYVSYTRSRSEYVFEQFLTNLMQNSLDVVTAPAGTEARLVRGGYTCRVNTTNPTAGCIPAPFLNADTVAGRLPTDWVNYVFRPVTGTTEYTETVASVGFDGPLFTLPAGQVQAFVGAEYRKAEIDDTPGYDMQTANLWNFSTASPTRGEDSVKEVFGEIEVPLLANMPGAQELTLNASARYTDYESYGEDTTYKVGLVYTPFSFMTLRGTYGTSYRAPALFEQFVGATSGFLASTNDRCNGYDGPGVNPNRAANCASEGLPAGFTSTSSVRVITSGGAVAGLEAETSDNLTIGVILQPQLPVGWGELSFATDYYEIEINGGVSRIGSGAILNDCYDSSPADFAANAGYCALVERDPNTRALTVYDSYVNIATDMVKGLDYTVRYSNDFGPGRFVANLGVTQFTDINSRLFPDDPIENVVGTITQPEFSGFADASFAWDEWRVRYGVEWIGAMQDYDYYFEYQGFDAAGNGYDFDVPDYFLHSASVQYRSDEWTATIGVRNLFNEELPTISAGSYNRIGNAPLYSGYDYVGRSAFINLTKSF